MADWLAEQDAWQLLVWAIRITRTLEDEDATIWRSAPHTAAVIPQLRLVAARKLLQLIPNIVPASCLDSVTLHGSDLWKSRVISQVFWAHHYARGPWIRQRWVNPV